MWEETITDNPCSKEGWARVEVLSWMSRITLDIIGLAGKFMRLIVLIFTSPRLEGFHHEFNSLDGKEERDTKSGSLNQALGSLLRGGEGPGFLTILQATFPIFRIIVSSELHVRIQSLI